MEGFYEAIRRIGLSQEKSACGEFVRSRKALTRDEDDRNRFALGFDDPGQLQAIDLTGHLNVGHHRDKWRSRSDQLQRFFGRSSLYNRVARVS